MIRNGGGLIDVSLCDGFLYCASVFSKSIAKATFSFPYVLDPAFGALYHVHEVRRRAGDVMSYTFLLVSSEESVRRGSLFNKTARLHLFLLQRKDPGARGGGLRCLALEQKALAAATHSPLIWWRYIDDIFLLWTHGEEKLINFITYLNNLHPTVKFTSSFSYNEIPFLDVKVMLLNGRLETDLYVKPTDKH